MIIACKLIWSLPIDTDSSTFQYKLSFDHKIFFFFVKMANWFPITPIDENNHLKFLENSRSEPMKVSRGRSYFFLSIHSVCLTHVLHFPSICIIHSFYTYYNACLFVFLTPSFTVRMRQTIVNCDKKRINILCYNDACEWMARISR